MSERIDHPPHYGGGDNDYEVIKVIESWQLGFCLGNALKYLYRAGRKDPKCEIEDLKKALWYMKRRLEEHHQWLVPQVQLQRCDMFFYAPDKVSRAWELDEHRSSIVSQVFAYRAVAHNDVALTTAILDLERSIRWKEEENAGF